MKDKIRFLVLQGSPRKNGNTAELCKPFLEELNKLSAEVQYIFLADKDIKPCLGCYHCQNVQGEYGCIHQDDMSRELVREICLADCIVLAAPIYSWYCPTVMKSLLDRHYGLNKYYGTAEGSLWAGKRIALLLTHGYKQEKAVTPFVMGIQYLCKHSKLEYIGMYSARDVNGIEDFRTPEVKKAAAEFAAELFDKCAADAQ